jgi:hypothetical protein
MRCSKRPAAPGGCRPSGTSSIPGPSPDHQPPGHRPRPHQLADGPDPACEHTGEASWWHGGCCHADQLGRICTIPDLARPDCASVQIGGSRSSWVAVRDRPAAVVTGRPRGLSAWRLWPPGGATASPVRVLPGGTSDVGRHDIGRVPVQAPAGPVISHRGPRVSMRGGLLHIAQRHPGIETGRERFTNHAEWVSVTTGR